MAEVGIGFRPEIAGDLWADPARIDLVEVMAERCIAQPLARREAKALRSVWPVALHGVKLSLGSADGIDRAHAGRLGQLARDLSVTVVSEHVAFTRAGRRDGDGQGQQEIGHLMPLPRTREAVRTVARNVSAARRLLPDVPLLLENIACTMGWPDDDLDEGDFHAKVCEATGCDLLLDLGNLYANAQNGGIAPLDLLARYPLERVGMIHLGGGVLDDDFFFDTHAHPIPDEVFALCARALERTGPVPILVERDGQFPPFSELAREIDRARLLAAAAGDPRSRPTAAAPALPAFAAPHLAAMQSLLASALLSIASPDADAIAPFDARAVARTRSVLFRKRADEALSLLPRLAELGPSLASLALDRVRVTSRSPRSAAVLDALHVAEVACLDPRFAPSAQLDLLELRSRFVAPTEERAARARRAPFVGRARLPAGESVWAWKGPGLGARVHLLDRSQGRPPGRSLGPALAGAAGKRTPRETQGAGE